MRLPIQVQCILFRNSSEFLLLKRIPERGGFWQPVTGGFEESDTSLKKACLREVEEETGISSVINFYEDVDFFQFEDDEGVVLSEYVFAAEVPSKVNVQLSSEHSEHCWVDFQKAMELLRWDSNKNALKKCKKLLE